MHRLLLLLALICTAPAWAGSPRGCEGDITGLWDGHVMDGGMLARLKSMFALNGGELTGAYHIDNLSGSYDGTLTDFSPLGPCSGVFVWHDKYGSGMVEIIFMPRIGRFDGRWGAPVPEINRIFDGLRPPATS